MAGRSNLSVAVNEPLLIWCQRHPDAIDRLAIFHFLSKQFSGELLGLGDDFDNVIIRLPLRNPVQFDCELSRVARLHGPQQDSTLLQRPT